MRKVAKNECALKERGVPFTDDGGLVDDISHHICRSRS